MSLCEYVTIWFEYLKNQWNIEVAGVVKSGFVIEEETDYSAEVFTRFLKDVFAGLRYIESHDDNSQFEVVLYLDDCCYNGYDFEYSKDFTTAVTYPSGDTSCFRECSFKGAV